MTWVQRRRYNRSCMTKPLSPHEKAALFLATGSHFKLGELPTEQPHPKTSRLAETARENLPAAIEVLRAVEIEAVRSALERSHDIERLALDIERVFANGGKVFLCGCGATGRLSLSLETLWRKELNARKLRGHESHHDPDQVVSFMAGGDYALVRSIENFEDHPEYGARQLREAGFGAKDLLIACTEGGETPFVIGAAEEAATVSLHAPYFLFCNPEDILSRRVERSRRVLENENIHCVSFATGPMALSGSTRLQASTVLMLAVGAALFECLGDRSARRLIEEFLLLLDQTAFGSLAPLIERESEVYSNGDVCLHRSSEYAITVLTDTTERSPTFSLAPFESTLEKNPVLAWTYLEVESTESSLEAWRMILEREPRALTWPEIASKYGPEVLLSFDFSKTCERRRSEALPSARQYVYSVRSRGNEIVLDFDGHDPNGAQASFPRPDSLLLEHLLLKCALNISSTLVMGRLGRFRGNSMLYVRSSNNKLVDRSIRYVQALLREDGIHDHDYEDIAYALFEVLETLGSGEAAVLKTYEKLTVAAGSPPHAARAR